MNPETGRKIFFALGRPFSPLYGLAMRLREQCYRKGIFKSEHFPVPVISVGNLTLGGTGKTPMVQAIVRLLLEAGKKPAVISRGYGGSTKEPINIVSDGSDVLLPADLVGDEPRLLAETLPGAMVLTGVVRRLPARRAVEMGVDVLVLDDGFQHLAVARDLDLVLFSADHLAGNSRIFPGGDLREPVAALARASCFVLTGVETENQDRAERFANLLVERFPSIPVYSSQNGFHGWVRRSGETCQLASPDPDVLEKGKVLALCGIARPDSFRATLARCGVTPAAFLALPDHHQYKHADLARIRKQVQQVGAELVVTTEKDLVKLGGADLGAPVYAARLKVALDRKLQEMVLNTATSSGRSRVLT